MVWEQVWSGVYQNTVSPQGYPQMPTGWEISCDDSSQSKEGWGALIMPPFGCQIRCFPTLRQPV